MNFNDFSKFPDFFKFYFIFGSATKLVLHTVLGVVDLCFTSPPLVQGLLPRYFTPVAYGPVDPRLPLLRLGSSQHM